MKFVARATSHPQEDLDRNWSAPMGGLFNGDFHICNTLEECHEMWEIYYEDDDDNKFPESKFRFHPAYNGFVEVHYEGLGAYRLEAESLEDAQNEILTRFNNAHELGCIDGAGDGHFNASDCTNFFSTAIEDIYIFQID